MYKKSLLIGTAAVSASIGLIYGMKKLVGYVRKTQEESGELDNDGSDFACEITYPDMPDEVTDDEYIHCLELMKKFVLGEIKLKDMGRRERRIVEVLIYNKISCLPEDPHLNNDAWFWGKNLGSFTKRMKSSYNQIYIRLIDMANSCSMPDWASSRVRGWEM